MGGTAAAVQQSDGSGLASMTPLELRAIRTLELRDEDGAWSCHRIASVYKQGAENVTFVALDGSTITIDSGRVSVTQSSRSSDRRLRGRRLPHYHTWGWSVTGVSMTVETPVSMGTVAGKRGTR